ncbi:MAG: acetylxylan esterase [Gemmataceae bacterium]
MTPLLLALLVPAADPAGVLPATPPPRAMLRTYLMAECQKQFEARRTAIARLRTPEDIAARNRELRARFIASLGGFPERTPLRPRMVGTLTGEGYTIEKVVYESRPNHHVTASFYRPAGAGPFPGVLMPIGHSTNGKAAEYVQRGCILLAKNGIAVLAYDPIGQGERRQLLTDKGLPVVAGTTTEHTLVGVGALLVGAQTASYRIWDGIRSLDYLASRPEVDPKKLGCTGCSGGGTLTSYLMALDDRIAAAAPSCYLTTLERLFETIGPQDAEQNITGQVAFGMDHPDYMTLRAPRATLVCAATGDFFDIQGTWAGFREAKRLYTLLGHPERLDILESATKHGYPREHREGMARWMLRWLAGRDVPIVEGEMKLAPDAELLCTRTGQVLEDLKGISAFGLSARRARELAEKRPPVTAEGVAKRLKLTLPVPAAKRSELPARTTARGPARPIVFETEPGIRVPGILFEPDAKAKAPLTLLVHSEGMLADAEAITQRVKEGRRVLTVDLRGWGETAPAPAPAKPGSFGVDMREAFLSLHLDRSLTTQRVHDLLAIVAQLGEDVEAVGIGKGATVVLHAAVLSPRIKAVQLERSLVSWSNVVETPLAVDQLTQVVPGALASYDLPDLAALLAPRPLTVVAPVDATGKALSSEQVSAAYAKVSADYGSAKGKFRVVRKGP